MRLLRRGRPTRQGVCHLTTSHPPADTRILLRECGSLSENGYDVELHVVTSGPPPEPVAGPVPVVIHGLRLPGRFARLLLRPWFGLAVGLRTGRKVIHIHDPEMIALAPLFVFAGRSVVYDVHEDVPRQILAKEWIPAAVRSIVAAGFERLENWCTSRVSVVVAATDAIADRFEQVHPLVFRVRNFASADHFPPPAPVEERRYDVCFVGVINAVRGAEQMLAIAERSNARVVFAGPCHPPELAARFEAVAATTPSFEFRGPVPHHEAVRIMGDSKLGLLLFQPVPNNVDAQPNKLYEYLAAGTPVLGPHFPRFVDVIGRGTTDDDGVGATIDPTSSDDAVAAVRALLADPARLSHLGARARRVFEERFSWETELKELLRAYEALPIPTGA
ncbi:MAG: glycosyltransferase [Acidimicrobiales bacterium]